MQEKSSFKQNLGDSVETKKTIHVLYQGQPLCGFSPTVPRDWPKGHLWVGMEDIKDANCSVCKTRAKKLEKISK